MQPGTLFEQAKALLQQKKAHEAEALFEELQRTAGPAERAVLASQAGLLAHKAGEAHLAVRWFRRAGELAPRDPEARHDRGLAHLEAGEVGLAAQAQAEALLLDPNHTGARAQRAAALEALGDDEGAAREWGRLLERIGPQIALQARRNAMEDSARRAAQRRLVGNAPARLAASPLVGSAMARSLGGPHLFRAPFAELSGTVEDGRLVRVDLLFDSMDASMGRSDLSYGGSTEDEHGRRVPLDEFSAAAMVFLAESLGIETVRARRLLAWLLTAECGLGPHPVAGCLVGWSLQGEDGQRRYGLFAQEPRETRFAPP